KLAKRLRDNTPYAARYVNTQTSGRDKPAALLDALQAVVAARGGVAAIAQAAGIKGGGREHGLAGRGRPRVSNVMGVERGEGLRLTVAERLKSNSSKRSSAVKKR